MVMETLTGILVLITAIYAYLTYKLAQSSAASVAVMERQNWQLVRPYIVVSPFVRPHTPFLYLRIENSGRSSASSLKLTIDKDFYQFGESRQNLRNKVAFTQTIDAFHPGQELIFGLAQGWKIFGEKGNEDTCPEKFNITVAYECDGVKMLEVHPVDLSVYIGSEGEKEPVVEELERIRKVLEKLK